MLYILLSSYFKNAPHLFDRILKENMVSVQKHEGNLTHNYAMENVLNEFIKDIHDKCPDIKPKAFKSVPT